ncbi:MAG: DUF2997 domain-containing protein [Deltaproteobacteria bacterium]|nr:DUF2997 domain-containing protein [Deltaproteobacteria bacterium]
MEEVKVTIDEEGNVKLTVFGTPGPRCLEVTKKLEELLGGDVTRELTSQYYQTDVVKEHQKVKDKA